MSSDSPTDTGDSILVFTNFPSQEVARKIGKALVEKQLAACINILSGCESIYLWEGKIEQEAEIPALIKTTLEKFGELETVLTEMHPYDTPEVIALPIIAGSQAYLDWIQACVGPSS